MANDVMGLGRRRGWERVGTVLFGAYTATCVTVLRNKIELQRCVFPFTNNFVDQQLPQI